MDEHGCLLWELLQFGEVLGTRNGCMVSTGLVITLIVAAVLMARGVSLPWLIGGVLAVNLIWIVYVLRTGGNLEL